MKKFKFCLPVNAEAIVVVEATCKENALVLLKEGHYGSFCIPESEWTEAPTLDHLVSEVELTEE